MSDDIDYAITDKKWSTEFEDVKFFNSYLKSKVKKFSIKYLFYFFKE